MIDWNDSDSGSFTVFMQTVRNARRKKKRKLEKSKIEMKMRDEKWKDGREKRTKDLYEKGKKVKEIESEPESTENDARNKHSRH